MKCTSLNILFMLQHKPYACKREGDFEWNNLAENKEGEGILNIGEYLAGHYEDITGKYNLKRKFMEKQIFGGTCHF